jgi:hypothetical protein
MQPIQLQLLRMRLRDALESNAPLCYRCTMQAALSPHCCTTATITPLDFAISCGAQLDTAELAVQCPSLLPAVPRLLEPGTQAQQPHQLGQCWL